MSILDTIIKYKREQVTIDKNERPLHLLERSEYYKMATISLKQSLLMPGSSGIIAEFKRKSPSKGMINNIASVVEVTTGYVKAGVAAISVLTDEKFFGGINGDIIEARKNNACPILRKEFIIDEYQIFEAKSIGADAVLLIASVLEKQEIKTLASVAISLGLEVLLELHDELELAKVPGNIEIIGINNRDLKTFQVDMEQSKRMAGQLGNSMVKVAESGIDCIETIIELKKNGFQGFLMGEHFMKTENPGKTCKQFIEKMKT